MRPPILVNRLLFELSSINRESPTLSDLLAKASERIRASSPTISAIPKELYSHNGNLDQMDEFIINTGKPYTDNKLSGYSAFKELINHYNSGFRSCIILPIKDDNKALGTITLLSKDEDAFDNEAVDALVFISEQISKEASLKIEKEKSNTVAKYFDAAFNSSVPQLLIDRNGTIIKANKATINLLDKTGKELSGKGIGDVLVFSEGDLEKMLTGKPFETMTSIGEGSFLRITASKVNERLFHLVLFNNTEIKQIEERAKFLENSDDETFLTTDNETRILWISDNIGRVIGIDKGALLGDKLSDFIQYAQNSITKFAELKTGAYVTNARMDFGNGVIVPVRIKAYKNSSGFSFIISKDYNTYIDTLKKGLDDIIGLSNDPIMIIDESGNIKSQNKSAERMLKYKGDVVGVPLSSLFADSDSVNSMSNAISIVKKADLVTDVFVKFRSEPGEEPIPFTQNIKTIRDENSVVRGYIIFGTDLRNKQRIMDLKDALDKMELQARNYKSESQLKDQFIFDISHELRTPVTNISGFSKLLLQGEFGELTREQKEYMEIIVKELDRLRDLIQQVLDLIKISSGRMKLDLQQFNFNDLMKNPSIKSLEEVCQGKGLAYSCKIGYDVPLVTADPNRLIQVFVNLIGNSIKFTENGSITVLVNKKAKQIKVEVIDTGMGISKDDQHKLFKKFHQLPKKGLVKQEGSGTGLGLAITKEIINKHGGKIGVDSEGAGKGSVFWFTIPITPNVKKKKQEQKIEK